MNAVPRYLRLLLAFARFGLARELAFRANFLAKVVVEILWLFILLIFYETVFGKTNVVADWSKDQYLFFVGCYFALEGVIETFFLENCNEFADLVRTGNLDLYLLRPIDEQFLITCRNLDWSTAPNVLLGAFIMGSSLWRLGWRFDAVQLGAFLALFACGVAMAYSFMLVLTSTSIWFMRNQSLYEMWWLATSLMRYPKEIFRGPLASPLGWFFTFVLPILLVVNVPAEMMVKAFDPALTLGALVATLFLLWSSRKFFRYALHLYRSASS
jgi:ABC-2 type transport system permease protein